MLYVENTCHDGKCEFLVLKEPAPITTKRSSIATGIRISVVACASYTSTLACRESMKIAAVSFAMSGQNFQLFCKAKFQDYVRIVSDSGLDTTEIY